MSLLLAAGVPLEVISKLIGHKSWTLTLDTYSHLLPQASRKAADALNTFLNEHMKPAEAPAKPNRRSRSGAHTLR